MPTLVARTRVRTFLDVGETFATRPAPVGGNMRVLIAAGAAISMLLGAASAHAEKRLFIIANDGDGYGVDNCLATGGPCGTAVANSYCHAREFAQATSFRKVDRDDITGAIPSNSASSCHGTSCDNFVAIECTR
jgi:hypothetical protein